MTPLTIVAAVLAGVAVFLAFVMVDQSGYFDDSACDAHHFDDGEVVGYIVKKRERDGRRTVIDVKQKVRRSCQHEGCNATDETVEHVNARPPHDKNVDDALAALNEAVNDE